MTKNSNFSPVFEVDGAINEQSIRNRFTRYTDSLNSATVKQTKEVIITSSAAIEEIIKQLNRQHPRIDETNRANDDLFRGATQTADIESGDFQSDLFHKNRDADKSEEKVHNDYMSDINRDELEARLQNQELKTELRIQGLENQVLNGINGVNHSIQLLGKDIDGVRGQLDSVRGLKLTIILNSIAVIGFVVAVMAYGVSTFDSGRDTASLMQDVKQQSLETKQLLDELKKIQQQPSKDAPQ